MKLKVEYLNKNDLKPYANNAKLHPAEQIDQIKNSIREFGFNDPIAVWHDNEIIEGHGRLLAVMEMDDIEKVPVIRLDDLTDEQRKAYMLAHNKLTMNSEFDVDLVTVELDDIFYIDMEQFGFETSIYEFDETDLDSDETKEDVIVSINCGAIYNYESVKERLQNITDEIGGTMSVKMQ